MTTRLTMLPTFGLVFTAALFIPVACYGQISRPQAASLISGFAQFSEPITGDVRVGEIYVMGNFNDDNPVYSALIATGYLRVAAQPNPLMHTVSLTPKGKTAAANWKTYKNYMGLAYMVPYAKREVIAVTGVTVPGRGQNQMLAKFKWRLIPVGDVGKAMTLSTQTFEGEAYFQKFDSGWRVVQVAGPGLAPKVRIQ